MKSYRVHKVPDAACPPTHPGNDNTLQPKRAEGQKASMIIFSPSYGYSQFRRMSCAVAVIKSIGIKTINKIWRS